jgi:hypothetical protein
LKNFESLYLILKNLNIEGFVIYNLKTNTIKKLRKDCFFDLKWPSEEKLYKIEPDIIEY